MARDSRLRQYHLWGIMTYKTPDETRLQLLNEMMKLASAGKLAQHLMDLLASANISESTFRSVKYAEDRKLAKLMCFRAQRKTMFLNKLHEYAKSGQPFSVAGVNTESGMLSPTWSSHNGIDGLRDVVIALREENRKRPGIPKTKLLNKWLREKGIDQTPTPPPTCEEIQSRIDEIQSRIDESKKTLKFKDAEVDASSKVSAKVQAYMKRRAMNEGYFDHRPDMQLSPLPPISRSA
jgi:hypothetical protein